MRGSLLTGVCLLADVARCAGERREQDGGPVGRRRRRQQAVRVLAVRQAHELVVGPEGARDAARRPLRVHVSVLRQRLLGQVEPAGPPRAAHGRPRVPLRRVRARVRLREGPQEARPSGACRPGVAATATAAGLMTGLSSEQGHVAVIR